MNQSKFSLAIHRIARGKMYMAWPAFLRMRINGDLAAKLDRSLSSTVYEVSLAKNIVGYYAPSKCHAYCTEANLIWFTQGQVHILGSKTSKNKDSDIAEFTKSANSLIEKITAPD